MGEISVFLFLAASFFLIFIGGRLLEKIRVPWIFSALIIGAFFSFYSPFKVIAMTPEFTFLANLGMYFLLFMIGFELNIHQLNKQKHFIFKSTFFIIFIEALLGSLLIHFVFGYTWMTAIIVALSFATVGEAVLIPILEEFKITNTKLGQSIIGIGIFDDIIEILLLIAIVFIVGSSNETPHVNMIVTVIALVLLFTLTILLTKVNKKEKRFSFISIESLFIIILCILFLFLGIGEYAHSMPIASLLAGIAVKTFIPQKRIEKVESEIKTFCYGFFAPLFFLSIGISLEFSSLIVAPLMILLVIIVSAGSKIIASYSIGKKKLGVKESILLGIGISVRFSTGIIIVKILLENNLIDSTLYSVIIASSIIFQFLIPILFSYLVVKWHIKK